jgi:hypothetical protein
LLETPPCFLGSVGGGADKTSKWKTCIPSRSNWGSSLLLGVTSLTDKKIRTYFYFQNI